MPTPRPPANPPTATGRRLPWSLYSAALAASALPGSGDAAVIWSGPQAAHSDRSDRAVPIDLDGDGVVDFGAAFYVDFESTFAIDRIAAGIGNGVLVRRVLVPHAGGLTRPLVRNLAPGEEIGPQAEFDPGSSPLRTWTNYSAGPTFGAASWPRSTTGIVGARLGDRYGWIRLQFRSSRNFGSTGVTVFDWAYESVPGRPIGAGTIPEPATGALTGLGLLALGAKGVRRSRRHRRDLEGRRSGEVPGSVANA